MTINKDNYEIIAMNYLDGNLSASEVAEFMLFLAENPKIEKEVEQMRELFPAEEGSETVDLDFSFLKKDLNEQEISEQNFDEFCIASIEGDLSARKETELQVALKKDKSKAEIYDAYLKTQLKPDKQIVFEPKHSLKHNPATFIITRRLIYSVAGIAAGILLLFGIFRIALNNNNTDVSVDLPVAQVEEVKVNTQPNKPITTVDSTLQVKKPVKTELKTEPTLQEKVMVAQQTTQSVYDTTADIDGFIPISGITAGPIASVTAADQLTITPPSVNSKVIIVPEASHSELEEIQEEGRRILASSRTISVDNILRKSVEGINQLVETDIQYHSELTDDGKLEAFALSTERFNIKKKIRSN